MALLLCLPTDVCGGLYVADDDVSVDDAALGVVTFDRVFEAAGAILLDFWLFLCVGGFFFVEYLSY